MRFDRLSLQKADFTGWVSFADMRTSSCPSTGGIYVVTYGGESPAVFPDSSCGGWFKGKNPSVPAEALAANWVPDAEVVYIGKAGNLKRRLREFADFGEGKPVGHWGGRLIWQLPDVAALRVAWRETPELNPSEAERELIEAFRRIYAKPPFANDPHRLGK